MPREDQIVINTGPILAIVAATDELEILKSLYKKVLVPKAVSEEILCPGHRKFSQSEFNSAHWLDKLTMNIPIATHLIPSKKR